MIRGVQLTEVHFWNEKKHESEHLRQLETIVVMDRAAMREKY